MIWVSRVSSEAGRQSLRHELLDAVVRQDADERRPSAGAGGSSSGQVLNRDSGVVHAILIGPPTMPAAAWSTRCGWRFGLAAHALEPGARRVSAACARCFRGCDEVPAGGGELGQRPPPKGMERPTPGTPVGEALGK